MPTAAATEPVALGPVPIHWPVSLAEYHRDLTCESNSTLGWFLEDRWDYYLGRVKRVVTAKPPGDEVALGSAFHLALLQPYEWDEQVVIVPGGATRGCAKGKACVLEHPDSIVIDEGQHALIPGMLKAVQENGEAVALLERIRYVEHPIRWLDEQSGIGLKASFDMLLDDGEIADIKTASNPLLTGYRSFGEAIKNYGYYRQAALYCRGRDLYTGYLGEGTGHCHLVVGTGPHPECFVYRLSPQWLERGRLEIDMALAALADCRAFGDIDESVWHGPAHSRVTEIPMPGYMAFKEI